MVTIIKADDSGFPHGHFVIRSLAHERVLDVERRSCSDGAEVVLWPEREKSLVEELRDQEANNQVFFIDETGALCSLDSGHAIDVQDGHLVLRHRRPVIYPFPNKLSHNLPRFNYSPKNGEITVTFDCDPSYPIDPNSSTTWKDKTYILSAIPQRRPPTFVDEAARLLTSAVTAPFSFFSGGSPPPSATIQEMQEADVDLREDEVLEQDRAPAEEADDSLDPLRRVRVLALTKAEIAQSTMSARTRMQWEVLPLRKSKATFTR